MMSFLKSRKAQVNDFVAGVVLLFVFAVVGLFTYLILSSFITQFGLAGINTAYMDVVAGRFLSGVRVLDYISIVVLLAVVAGVGVSSFKVATHPVFFVITFVLAPFLGFMGYVLSYVFSQIASNSVFSSTIVFFPRTILIATNLHWVMLACIVVGSVAMFAKKSDRGQFINE